MDKKANDFDVNHKRSPKLSLILYCYLTCYLKNCDCMQQLAIYDLRIFQLCYMHSTLCLCSSQNEDLYY